MNRACIATSLLLFSLAGCGQPAASNPVGYRHSGADTLQVLVPVCDAELVTKADLQRKGTETGIAPPLGIDIPPNDGMVDFLIGYPGGTTPYSKDLRLTITTSRTTYDVHIPPVNQDRPTGEQWQRSGDGALVSRADLAKALSC